MWAYADPAGRNSLLRSLRDQGKLVGAAAVEAAAFGRPAA